MSGRIVFSTAVVLGVTLLAIAIGGIFRIDTQLAAAAKAQLRAPHRVTEQVRFEDRHCSPARDLSTHI